MRMKKTYKLTAMQKHFVQRYFIHGNASRAYVEAGFSAQNKNTVHISANKLKNTPAVQWYIKQLNERTENDTLILKNKVIEEISKLAFSNIKDVVTVDRELLKVRDLNEIDGREIQSISCDPRLYGTKVKVNMYNKLDALEKLCKHLGLYEKDNEQKATEKQVMIVGGKEIEF